MSDEIKSAQIAAWASVVSALIAAGATIVALFISNTLDSQGEEQRRIAEAVGEVRRQLPAANLSSVSAEDVISLDIPPHGVLTGPTLNVTGRLNTSLPSGVTIWVASDNHDPRRNTGTSPNDTVGIDAGGPCAVDADHRRFDCGEVFIGAEGEKGEFDIYVGLAESTQARQLVALINEQVCSRPVPQAVGSDGIHRRLCTEEYDHSAPAGVKWLPTVRRTRV